jgi:hypothetical protein
MYETLVLYTGLALASYEEGKGGNAESLKIARQLAGMNLRAVTGIPPDKINFTDQGLSIDNGSKAADASANAATDSPVAPTPMTQTKDPFPDRPGYAPQKPLSGTLHETITIADLVGTWDQGAGSVQTYIDSNTGNYSRTDTVFYSEHYSIKADGTFEYKFTGRSNNHTTRESDSGIVILSGGSIILKFNGRSAYRYQFISFMTQPNGSAILTLVPLGANDKLYDADWMVLECGHASGYIRCAGGEEWARLSAKPARQ